ncbi:MAG TPA: hypothetical protein VHV74_25185 [Pseudonocardiaceae bacterium]|nr:hypothetical protein [Pseudonocardiaceae bacterium]
MPLACRPKVTGQSYVDHFTHNVLRVVAHLVDRRTVGLLSSGGSLD